MFQKNTSTLFSSVFLALFLTSTLVFAKETWSDPAQVSFQSSNQISLSVDPNGNAYGIWQSFDGTCYQIQTANLPENGSWTAPATLSEYGRNALSPKIANDATGTAIAIWSAFDGEHFIIQSSMLVPSGIWSLPVALSEAGQNALYPVLAASTIGQGSAIAAWSRYNGSYDIVQAAFHSKNNGWSSHSDLSLANENATISQVTINPRSHAFATFSNIKIDGNEASAYASFYNGENWSLTALPEGAKDDTSIAMDRKGNAICAWSKFDLSTNRIVIYASFLRAGKTWSTPRLLSDPSQNAHNPKVRMSENGHAVVLWMGSQAENELADIFVYASHAKFNQWSTAAKLSSAGQKVCEIDLAVNSLGEAIAIWTAYSDKFTSNIQSSRLNAKGKWGKPKTISSQGKVAFTPAIDMNSQGNAVALWVESDPTTDTAGQADAMVWSATLKKS